MIGMMEITSCNEFKTISIIFLTLFPAIYSLIYSRWTSLPLSSLRKLNVGSSPAGNTTSTKLVEEEEEEEEEEGGADFVDIECAVCLSQVSPGEKYRVLPVCRHGFHVYCIDSWLRLYDHPTCPLCRTAIIPDHYQREYDHHTVLMIYFLVSDIYQRIRKSWLLLQDFFYNLSYAIYNPFYTVH